MFKLGVEVFLQDDNRIQSLKEKRVAYLGNKASTTSQNTSVLSLLSKKVNLTAILSPQHGFHLTEEANMITTANSEWEGIPLFSLYSKETRRLTPEIKKHFDVLVIDLQDVGCRIYTYLTTLFYLLEDCEESHSLILFDRPNPLGSYVEGSLLDSHFKSFVGAAPLPMSHGLTLGEAGLWFKKYKKLKTNFSVIPMENYQSSQAWPSNKTWIKPSPNMTSLSCAQCYLGSVLLEGTHLSEGRGTPFPFEIFGMPNMKTERIQKRMKELNSSFLNGISLSSQDFKPTFDKFKGETCSGLKISIKDFKSFRPYRFISLFLKCFLEEHNDFNWKTSPPYEYEYEKLPFDILTGSSFLREWIEDSQSTPSQLEDYLRAGEEKWEEDRIPFLLYS